MQNKPGAPKGNKNARKHGFYSHACMQSELWELSQSGIDQRQNNIKFCKVRIARIAERVKPSAANPLSFQENVLALRTLAIALMRLYSAVNTNHQMLTGRKRMPKRS